MVGVRIEEAAKAIGRNVETVASCEEAGRRLRSGVVGGLVVDLAISGLDIDELVRGAREAPAWLIAFHPHVNVELRMAAQRAGIERVYPRSRFLRVLPEILLVR